MSVSKVHGGARDARIAGIDLSDALFTLVALNNVGQFVRPAAGGQVYGSVYETAPQGRPATVAVFAGPSIIKVQAGATIAPGARVMATAAGLVITATTTNVGIGIARNGGAIGDRIEVVPTSTAATVA